MNYKKERIDLLKKYFDLFFEDATTIKYLKTIYKKSVLDFIMEEVELAYKIRKDEIGKDDIPL